MEPQVLLAIAAALLGAILGSFLNALLYRFNTGSSVMRGRSRCMRCGTTLEAADLIPVLSYLFLGGKCRYCRTRISPQYPLVELTAAALSVLVYLQHPEPLQYAYGLLVWLTLLFIVVYDLRHKIIPWEASGLLFALAAGGLVAMRADAWAWAAGPLLALPLFLIFLLSGGRAMGGGDAPLELSLGWLLGLLPGLAAFMIAFWCGALAGIASVLYSQWQAPPQTAGRAGYTMKSEIPLAPFLIFGAWCVYFLHVDIFSTLSALFR